MFDSPFPPYRLKAWAVLACEVVKAEFPDFDAMLSMRVFDLSRDSNTDVANCRNDMTRLAQTFQCDIAGLIAEWQEFRPRALHHATRSDEDAGNAAAWVAALKETIDVKHKLALSARHPSANIMAVLAPYMSISMSDSFLERSFSRAEQAIGSQSRKMDELTEAYRMTMLALRAEDIAMVYPRITKLWKDTCPPVRNGNFSRIDTGRKKQHVSPKKCGKPTETEFLQQRRKAVNTEVNAGAAATFAVADLPEGFDFYSTDMGVCVPPILTARVLKHQFLQFSF